MTVLRSIHFRPIRRLATLAIGAAAFILPNIAAKMAAAQNSGSFTLEVCEKEMKLANPTDMMWDKWLMWDTSSQREDERNMPYFELTNSLTSTAPITEFHLTIGDSKFNFAPVEGSSYALLGSIKTHSITSGTLNNAGNELIVNIGDGGLAPGESIRFKVNLNVDASYAATYASLFGNADPDFRTILFDMNGRNVYEPGMPVNVSSSDNAHAWAIYNPATGANFQTDPAPFADDPVAAANYFNNLARQYGEMDPVLIFDLEGTTSHGEVPEPTGALLVLLGIVGTCVGGSRPRRAQG